LLHIGCTHYALGPALEGSRSKEYASLRDESIASIHFPRYQMRYQVKSRLVIASLFLVALLALCASLQAHHGNAAYDDKHPITIAGNVTEFVWSNPHCQIYLDVKDDKGNVLSWSVESQSPGILRRNSWTRDSIKPGDHIAVTLIPAKSGAPVGFSGEKIGKVVFDDGHVLKMDLR
jgi:uncharacterized protein DUF6152